MPIAAAKRKLEDPYTTTILVISYGQPEIYRLFNDERWALILSPNDHHSSMHFPPGPLYLLRNFPYFAIPSTIVYTCLTLSKKHLDIDIPTWFTVFTVILARPAIFIFNRYHSRFSDSRHAAASNAIVAPRVRESAFSIISKIAKTLKKGYPGTFWRSWFPVQTLQSYFPRSRLNAGLGKWIRKCFSTRTFDQ